MNNKYLEKIAEMNKVAIGIPGLPNLGKAILGIGGSVVKGLGKSFSNATGGQFFNHAANVTGIKDPSKLQKFGNGFAGRRNLVREVMKKNSLSGRQGARDAMSKIRNIPTRPVGNVSASGPTLNYNPLAQNKGVWNKLKTNQTAGRIAIGGAAVGTGLLARKISQNIPQSQSQDNPQYYTNY